MAEAALNIRIGEDDRPVLEILSEFTEEELDEFMEEQRRNPPATWAEAMTRKPKKRQR